MWLHAWGFDENGGFDFEEFLAGEKVADGIEDLGAVKGGFCACGGL